MTVDDVCIAKDAHQSDLMALPHVVGVGVGRDADGYHIAVYLSQPSDDVPSSINGVPVRTRVIGKVVAR